MECVRVHVCVLKNGDAGVVVEAARTVRERGGGWGGWRPSQADCCCVLCNTIVRLWHTHSPRHASLQEAHGAEFPALLPAALSRFIPG
jgi:hypothetical protein